MNNKIKASVIIVAMIVGTVLMIATVGAATPAPAFLPGLTVKDDHPKGCVDCHVNAGAGKDYRIVTGLAALKDVKHPDVSKIVKVVPTDCKMCHKDGTANALSAKLHMVHYADPTKNVFVTAYQGACLNCHTLNQTNGAMSVKTGPANW